jgi:hypothetical protein
MLERWAPYFDFVYVDESYLHLHKHAKQNKTKHIPSHVKSAKKLYGIYDLG